MSFKHFLFTLALVGCVKHVEPTVPSVKPVISPDHTWAYYVDGPSDWVVISRIGTKKPLEVLCPKDAVCTVQEMGIMYHVRRIH